MDRALDPSFEIVAIDDANQGRGVFSRVLRISLRWPSAADGAADRPASVVVKLPLDGANGDAARASGAYEREALAYRQVLPRSPVATPRAYRVETDAAGTSLVMEDLTPRRAVDQLDGLESTDALAVAGELRAFHHRWEPPTARAGLAVRTATPSLFDPVALERGLEGLHHHGEDRIRPLLPTFRRLLDRREDLVERFARTGVPTLCHGDPRADNLVFADDGRPVLFDWQQLAVQLGAADLAWLAATSIEIEDRRRIDHDLVAAYGGTFDDYRTGLILPGLAVLMLAQRRLDDDRSRRFVATSIERIGAAITDLDVPGLRWS